MHHATASLSPIKLSVANDGLVWPMMGWDGLEGDEMATSQPILHRLTLWRCKELSKALHKTCTLGCTLILTREQHPRAGPSEKMVPRVKPWKL